MPTTQIYNDAVENATAALRKANGGSLATNRRLAIIAVDAALATVLRNADTIDDGRYLAIPTSELAAVLAR